jgi:predicted O-methyltransferase YrrM
MEHYYQNIGEDWFSYKEFYKSIVDRFDNAHFVEVGCWKGRSVCYMAVEIMNCNKNIKIDCVDIFEYSEIQSDISEDKYENIYGQLLNNIKPVRHIVTPVKGESNVVSKYYKDESLDFVFIDAAHDYVNVKNDINSWFVKVKHDGIIAGHDYESSDGVRQAVNEIFGESNIKNKENCWIYEKGKNA